MTLKKSSKGLRIAPGFRLQSELDSVEVAPPLLDFHLLGSPVIVLIENVLPYIHPVGDDLFRDVFRQEVSDGSPPD